MKMFIFAFAMLFSTAVLGDGFFQMSKSDRCEVWVTNALLGATQLLHGASREVQYIPSSSLAEMVTALGSVARDKVYILANENRTEEDRRFLEESTLFGYDAMSSWKSHNVGQRPNRDQWVRNLMATCMGGDAV